MAYVESTAGMGGAEHALLAILKRLPPDIVEPVFICPSDGPLIERVNKLGFQSHILALPYFASTSTVLGGKKIFNPFNSSYDIAAIGESARRLHRFLVQEQIELVHSNTMFAHLYGGLAARRARIPSVWHIHDFVEESRFGGGAGLIFRGAARLSNYLIAVSAAVQQAFSDLPGETLYIGVDVEEIERERRQPVEFSVAIGSVPLIAYVGRIAYAKGTDIFVRAASQVLEKTPNVCFVIAGDASSAEQRYADGIRRLIRDLGVEDQIILTGYQENVIAFMDQADCIVLPSRRESFGRVLIEAGALAKPAIASRVGGIPEIITDGETGILVSPENPQALANAIQQVLENRAFAEQLGRNARRRIESEFTLAQTADRIVHVYSQVVSPRAENPLCT